MKITAVFNGDVWRLDKTFPDGCEVEAQEYATLLERRLLQSLPIAETATVARKEAHPSLPVVHDLVARDLEIRRAHGMAKYGIPLQPFDGNDAIVEAYGEALDQVLYLRQAIYEHLGV